LMTDNEKKEQKKRKLCAHLCTNR